LTSREILPKASPSNNLSGLSLGLDIIEVARIESLAARSKKFLPRIFTEEEIAYCRLKKNPWPHFAVRFAAKEAVWKALGQKGLTLKDISVARDKNGRPSVLLRGKKVNDIELSLTHSRDYALAVAAGLAH
jgi:holo-[acyl-carrier protein] synthase